MNAPALETPSLPSRTQFGRLAAVFELRTGIKLTEDKVPMVAGRLQKRLRTHGLTTFDDYLQLLELRDDETQFLVEALTTHETSFFREPHHFAVLSRHAEAHPKHEPFRAWSAASSTGEEACSIAMTLASVRGLSWEVVGTDVAPETIRRAREGHYPLARGEQIPVHLKQAHCLRGTDEFDGLFRLHEALRGRLRFEVANLLEAQAGLGLFDVIFLRNVLIYFDDAKQQRIVSNVVNQLKPRGLLLVGHAERVADTSRLEHLDASVYRRRPS